ncbi:hypothetical protein GCM10009678_54670 [Actinomadura kijaniata]
MHRWRPLIERTVHHHLDDLATRDEPDLHYHFAVPVVTGVCARILGFAPGTTRSWPSGSPRWPAAFPPPGRPSTSTG